MKSSKMNTQLSGTKQLRDCKCLMLTTLRSNHPLSHGLFFSLFFCCGPPYFQAFMLKERRGVEREDVEIRREITGKLKCHNRNQYIKITISNILRTQCLEIRWTQKRQEIDRRHSDSTSVFKPHEVNHILYIYSISFWPYRGSQCQYWESMVRFFSYREIFF